MESEYYPYLNINAAVVESKRPLPTLFSPQLQPPQAPQQPRMISYAKPPTSMAPSAVSIKQEPSSPSSNVFKSITADDDDFEDEDDDEDDEDEEDADEEMEEAPKTASSASVVPCSIGYVIKQEAPNQPLKLCNAQSLLRPIVATTAASSTTSPTSTIVLTTKSNSNRLVIPKVNVKVEDSAPKPKAVKRAPRMSYGSSTGRQPIMTPLISCQPKGSTGPLHLTEEEKRTLISEGYPVPQRLPLSKQEEKSLKKIRRKIKNKISAQESRRKKKEYMDCLEKKMDALHSELALFKNRCCTLENQNAALVTQVKKLQAQLQQQQQQQTSSLSEQPTKVVAVMVRNLLSHVTNVLIFDTSCANFQNAKPATRSSSLKTK